MSDLSVLELVDLDLEGLMKRVIPCSGTGHFTGRDTAIHGDPTQPAEWMVRQHCPGCGHWQDRPVCDFFKNHGITEERIVGCSSPSCKYRDIATNFFTVLRRL